MRRLVVEPSVTPVHLAQIAQDDYPAFRRLPGNDFPDVYSEWLDFVRQQDALYRRKPYEIIYVRTRPDEFAAFCRDRSMRCDKNSLARFTIWKMNRER